jgi:hypothetical protein
MADTNLEGEPLYGYERLKIDGRQLASLLLVLIIVQGMFLSYWVAKEQWGNAGLQVSGVIFMLGALYLIKTSASQSHGQPVNGEKNSEEPYDVAPS